MIIRIRNSFFLKFISVFFAINLLVEIVLPTALYGIDGGPSQPEFNAFSPYDPGNLVNLATGDFQYSIPLMAVDGYPITLNYNSQLSMNQQASWVGLGWSLNEGALTRNMRGIPDEFNGDDKVTQELNIKKDWTVGTSASFGAEFFGFESDNVSGGLTATFTLGISYNDRTKFSISHGHGVSYQLHTNQSMRTSSSFGLNFTSTEEGLNISPESSFGLKLEGKSQKETHLSLGLGTTFNSRQGLKKININGSMYHSKLGIYNQLLDKLGKGSIDLVKNTFIPPVVMPMRSNSLTANFKMGVTIYGLDGTFDFAGYYSENKLNKKIEAVPAYGYQFYDSFNHLGMGDFNIEKDQAFNSNQTNLPVPVPTYDVYTATGHGIGGTFRPHKKQHGYLSDRSVSSSGSGYSLGFEYGVSGLAHFGVDISTFSSHSQISDWLDQNEINDILKYDFSKGEKASTYFKMADESIFDLDLESDYFDDLGEFSPVSVNLADGPGKFDVTAKQELASKYKVGPIELSSGSKERTTPANRSQPVSYLTKAEAEDHSRSNRYYPHGRAHHIGEFSITKEDGSVYSYGRPLYNLKYKDVSFNVSGNNYDCKTGLVQYEPDVDNNRDKNKKGKDRYFNAQTLDPYPYTWLLTEIVSPDYQDADGDGYLSVNDLGTFVEFKYDNYIPEFEWRSPRYKNWALYNEGQKTDGKDDRGSYSYGVKEIRYLDTIKTKKYVAVFNTSPRDDGYEVIDENGGRDDDGDALQKLDRISLFARPDFEADPSQAVPIKTVHFKYKYELCPGVESNKTSGDGKLTLERLYFTYQNSNQGILADYEFKYADTDFDGVQDTNYPFNNNTDNQNPLGNSRTNANNNWGTYKPIASGAGCAVNNDLPFFEYPEVDQRDPSLDQYAAAWALTEIKTPEGGLLRIEYETDDYAYVQNKPAMQFFKILGFGKGSLPPEDAFTSRSNFLYGGGEANRILFFELHEPYVNADTAMFPIHYLKGLPRGPIYFRVLAELSGNKDYEYVEGFAPIKGGGVVNLPDITSAGDKIYHYGYIRLKKVCKGDRVNNSCDVNPITKSILNFIQAYKSDLVYDFHPGGINVPDGGPGAAEFYEIMRSLLGGTMLQQIAEVFLGTNGILLAKKFGQKVIPEKSWIRLYNPNGKMKAGTNRVKRFTYTDNWDAMVDPGGLVDDDFTFGQEFGYTMEDGSSAGVASYLPIGSKENSMVMPRYFTEERLLAPDLKNYQLEPFGESFFPSPNITYRQVTVRNIHSDGSAGGPLEETKVGHSVHEFFTALDFPVRLEETRLQAKPKKTKLLGQLLNMNLKDYFNAAQGYYIGTTDMIGRKKSERVYGYGQTTAISGVNYVYETEGVASPMPSPSGTVYANTFNNTVTAIGPDGKAENHEMGVDVDVFTHFSQSASESKLTAIPINTATFMASILYILIPTVWPGKTRQRTRFRKATTVKHVHRRGILRKVIAYQDGASTTTENLAWDKETGAVLLTSITNAYGDKTYKFDFPAHWPYPEGMGMAFQNLGMELEVYFDSADGSITSTPDKLTPGDEVFEEGSANTYWVIRDDGGEQFLIDEDGKKYQPGPSITVKVKRSGHRNMHKNAVGSIVTTFNPIDHNGDGTPNPYLSFDYTLGSDSGVLQSQATEYSDKWQTLCQVKKVLGEDTTLNCELTRTGNNFFTALVDRNFSKFPCTPTIVDEAGNLVPWPEILSVISTTPTPVDQLPGEHNQMAIEVQTASGPKTIILTAPCGPLFFCGLAFETKVCDIDIGEKANPYFVGIRGNWRANRSYFYLTGREQTNYTDLSNPFQNLNIRQDGAFELPSPPGPPVPDFNPFWELSAGSWNPNTSNWQWATQVTKAVPTAGELENKDALGRFQSVVFGYNDMQPIAVAANANYNQIGFDGFEDYDFYDSDICRPRHFAFESFADNCTMEDWHTGRYSLKIDPAGLVANCYPLNGNATTTGADNVPYKIKPVDCAGVFGPPTAIPNASRYLLSFWAKKSNPDNKAVFDYPDIEAHLIRPGVGEFQVNDVQASPIIDGWQKKDYYFTIPNNATGDIQVIITNQSSVPVYVDDIRILPGQASMQSYVYDPITYRLMATLDENNFATINEYDEEGLLTRVKKETPRGIYTIQEGRTKLHSDY